jgi:2-keto-3-deoxy-L-rhamnonate aldolase RhmA
MAIMSEISEKAIEDIADKLSVQGVRVVLTTDDALALARKHYESLGKEKVQVTIRRAVAEYLKQGENP